MANNVGFAMLSGASVRYRFYSRWGVTAEELSRIVFSYSVTFWLGLLALGGLSLALEPLRPRTTRRATRSSRPIGWLLVGRLRGLRGRRSACVASRSACGGSNCRCPRRGSAVAQLVVSAIDWALAGGGPVRAAAPEPARRFSTFLGAFLAAQLLGLASHVPGGVGVFEGLMVAAAEAVLSPPASCCRR